MENGLGNRFFRPQYQRFVAVQVISGQFDVSHWVSSFIDVSGLTAKSMAPIFPSLKH
jgi:hypothetical protein